MLRWERQKKTILGEVCLGVVYGGGGPRNSFVIFETTLAHQEEPALWGTCMFATSKSRKD